MTDPVVLETLSSLPHFRLLERELLEQIGAGSRARRFASGEILFREGDPSRAFFAIRAGGVKLYRSTRDGREQVVHTLGPGQTFAEAAVLNLRRYPASAMATEDPTELIEVGGETFLRVFRGDPRLSAAMVGSLCMRLLSLVERVEELTLVNSGARLAHYLSRQPSTGPPGKVVVGLPMSKKDLAAHLSMTPETLSRLLRRWHDRRWIESDRGSVTILDGTRLLALANGEESSG
jgi:CRP-like cAMP-binding protein